MLDRVKDDEIERPALPRFNPRANGPDTREPTWADTGRAIAIGGDSIVSGAGAGVRRLGEAVDSPKLKYAGRAMQDFAAEQTAATYEEMTPSAKARMQASLDDPEFQNNIMSSLGLKLASTGPSMLVSVIPATLLAGPIAATIAATGVGAALNSSSLMDELYKQTDAVGDEELQKQSDVYAKLRETLNEPQAREEFNGIVQGMLPVYTAAASLLAGVFGPAAQAGRAITGGAASVGVRGGVKGVVAAGIEGGLSEGVEEGAVALGSEVGRVRTGERQTVDTNRVVMGTLEGVALGTTLGAGVGVLGAGSDKKRPANNPGILPSAQPKPNEARLDQSTTARASTDPAIAPPPVSPNSNPKTQATTSAPSTVTPATTAVGPRVRPPRAATGLEPAIAPVVAQPAVAVAAPVSKVEVANDAGLDAAISLALGKMPVNPGEVGSQRAPKSDVSSWGEVVPPKSPVTPKVAAVQQAVRARTAASPPGTVPTGFGPATPPVEAPVAPAVTPAGNDNQIAPAPSGVMGAAATAPARSSGASAATVQRPSPRVLEDVRPEIVEMNRDDAYQQREAMKENVAAIRAAEAGPVGRKDLTKAKQAKRDGDASKAAALFDESVPELDVIPTSKTQIATLKARVDSIVEQAKEAGVTIPTKIDYDGSAPTADHLIWLREAADLSKAFKTEKGPGTDHVIRFLTRERAAKGGDFSIMKSERRAEGDQAKRGAQGDVEKIASARAITREIDSEGDVSARPVASAASAEADAVPTVAGSRSRGAVRDSRSETNAPSAVRKIELTPEEKAAYAERLLAADKTKAALAGRVVDDAKFTKDVAEQIAKPAEVVKPKAKVTDKVAVVKASAKARAPEVIPAKVTPKTIKQKVAAAAKKVDKNPSQARIDADNYTKGPVTIQGIPVVIETPRGAMRRGVDSKGKPWEVKMPAHYGDIKRTEGADGDGVDVFIGNNPASDFVLVIDQMDARTGKFDEHKAFIGYPNVREALGDYLDSFSDKKGQDRLGEFTPMTIADFKEWLKGNTTKPVGDLEIAAEAEQDALIGPAQDTMAAAPDVELDDSDVRSDGPVIPYSNGVRTVETMTPEQALNAYVTPEGYKGLPGLLYPFLKRKLIWALQQSDVKVYFVTDENYAKLRIGKDPETDTSVGYYEDGMSRVVIRNSVRNAPPAELAHVIMHELAHAATVGKLNEERFVMDNLSQNKNSATYQLTALFLDVKKSIVERGESLYGTWGEQTVDRIYALTNVREFVAEAMSNPAFQDMLGKINVSSDVAMFLKLGEHTKVSFWNAFVSTVRKILGMPEGTYSALEAALSMSERLMYGSRMYDMEAQYNTRLTQGTATPVTPALLQARRRVDALVKESSDDILGLTGMKLQDAFEANVQGFLKEKADATTRSFGDPKALRFRSMTDIAALAKSYFRGNSVRRVVNAIEAIRVTGGDLARQAEPILNELMTAQRRYKGTTAFEDLASVMHDATMSGVHPDRGLDQNTQLGKKSMKGFWGRAQHAALQARYDALPSDLKDVYQSSMKYFQDQHNKLILQSVENRILKALGINDKGLADRIFNDTTTDADKETLGDLYELIAEPTEFKKVTGPYFPLKRFGNFVVRGTYELTQPTTAHRAIDENTFEFTTQAAAEAYAATTKNNVTLTSVYVDSVTGELHFIDEKGKQVRVLKEDTDSERRWRVRVQNKHLEFFENRTEAEERRAELANEGVRMEAVVMKRDDPNMGNADMLSTHMERLLKRIEARDSFKELSAVEQNEVRRSVEQASYAVLSSTRIQTTRIQRKYVAGASRDIIRSTAEYAGSMAGYLARYQHQGELDQALKDMNKETDSGGDPGTAMGRSMIREEIMYRMYQDNIAPSQQNSKIMQWKHRLLVTSFIGHLASPAYSLINAMQPIMVTTPVVSARHGMGATVAAMTKAYQDISAAKNIGAGIVNTARRIGDAQAQTNTYVSDVLGRITNPNEKAMIGHLIKHGSIDADAGLEISKLVDTTRGDQWLSYFEGISRQLPLAVESINRSVSALAAYRLEMKRSGDHDAAVLYAQEIVESTQGIYASTNTPPMFSSPIASVIFQFKKYGHLIYSLLGQQIGKAIRNDNVGDRAEALKALGFIVGAHMVMAGTVGLPTEPIKMLLVGANIFGLSGLTMEDFEEWERELAVSVFGDTAGEMITNGVLRGLPGGLSMDLSGRMGMQSYLTFGEPKNSEEGSIWSWIGETVGGAPGGMIMDMMKGAGHIANGDVTKGMAMAVPVKIIKDGIKAYQGLTEGKTSKSGRQTMEEMSYPEAAMKLFGITPGRAAENQAAASSYYRNTGRLREERSGLMDNWATATPSQRTKLWAKIQKWNKDQDPASRLSYSQLASYLRRRNDEERSGKVIGGMRVGPKEKAIHERVQRLYTED